MLSQVELETEGSRSATMFASHPSPPPPFLCKETNKQAGGEFLGS